MSDNIYLHPEEIKFKNPEVLQYLGNLSTSNLSAKDCLKDTFIQWDESGGYFNRTSEKNLYIVLKCQHYIFVSFRTDNIAYTTKLIKA